MNTPSSPLVPVRLIEPEAAAGLENDAFAEDAFQTGHAQSHSNIPELPHDRQQRTASRRIHPEESRRNGGGLRSRQQQHGSAHPAASSRARKPTHGGGRALSHAQPVRHRGFPNQSERRHGRRRPVTSVIRNRVRFLTKFQIVSVFAENRSLSHAKICRIPKIFVSLHRQSKEQPFVPEGGHHRRPQRVLNDGRRRSSIKTPKSTENGAFWVVVILTNSLNTKRV